MKTHGHLSAEHIQAFLDGALSQGEMALTQEHSVSCARCQAEIEAWRLLFDELEELPELAPSVTLSEPVLAALPVRAPAGLAGGSWLDWLSRPGSVEHLGPDAVQAYLDGALTPGHRAQLSAHVTDCESCRADVTGWQTLFAELEAIAEVTPSAGFAERVMERVQIRPAVAVAPRPLAARVRAWARSWVPTDLRRLVPAWAGRVVPRSRRAWAVVASVAATPTLAVAAGAWLLFSHPLLTPGYLASYLWWKASGLVGAVAGGAWGTMMDATAGLRSSAVTEAVTGSGGGLMLTGVGLTALMAASLWILYRNLFASTAHTRYAQITS